MYWYMMEASLIELQYTKHFGNSSFSVLSPSISHNNAISTEFDTFFTISFMFDLFGERVISAGSFKFKTFMAFFLIFKEQVALRAKSGALG